MPRAPSKRAAASAASGRQPKKAKSSGAASSTAASTSPAAPAPKSKRWSAVSVSRNADDEFRLAVQDPERANDFICICPPPFASGDGDDDDEDDDNDSDDDDDEDEDDDDDADDGDMAQKTKEGKQKCDGGETCICNKPANENPEHDWVVTYGGFRKWIAQLTMAAVRCPDVFGMYTYNDHSAYGTLEVIQNLLLDWVEAGTWQEQWVVCEGLVFFGLGLGSEFYMQVFAVSHVPLNALTLRPVQDRRWRASWRGRSAHRPPLPDHAVPPWCRGSAR